MTKNCNVRLESPLYFENIEQLSMRKKRSINTAVGFDARLFSCLFVPKKKKYRFAAGNHQNFVAMHGKLWSLGNTTSYSKLSPAKTTESGNELAELSNRLQNLLHSNLKYEVYSLKHTR